MLITKEVKLVRIAKKAGGDRYESSGGGFIVYIPQAISRPDAVKPFPRIKVTFEG